MTLDADVERLLRGAMKERDVSFKEALNEAARAGLDPRGRGGAAKFVQKTFRMGEAQEFRWDKALAAADAIEDEDIRRKLALRK